MRHLLALLPSLALVAQAPVPVPAVLTLPADLEVKPGSLVFLEHDRDSFEVRPAPGQRPVPVPAAGRVWRFALRAAGPRPMGAFALLERLVPALERDGWTLESRERAVAKRNEGDRQYWVKASAGNSGELKVVLVEKGGPRMLDLPYPGLRPELPKGDENFPYLPPWPGAKLTASSVSRAPVDVKLPDGTERIQMVNFLDKEYSLERPPSAYEFLAVYREALERAGWTLEGSLRGDLTQLQATYIRRGRDLRATLRLLGDAMGISVADVGAQLQADPPPPKR